MKAKQPEEKYAAMLLFQWRVMVDGNPGKRRLCEKRIINFHAKNAHDANNKANLRGKDAEYSAENDEGNPYFFEFIGVLDLQGLGSECEDDEVWYDVVEMITPMERKNSLVPDVCKLSAVKNEKAIANHQSHRTASTRSGGL